MCKFILHNTICRYGLPGELVIENGRQFTSQRLVSFYEEMGPKFSHLIP